MESLSILWGEIPMTDPVFKPWVLKMTWKAQSALMTSIRGCDTHDAPITRNIVRWMRNLTMYDADVKGTFVKYDEEAHPVSKLKRELEYMTVHYVMHLIHGLQVIAIFHDDAWQKSEARREYKRICDMFHLEPEKDEDCKKRLTDRRKE